MAVISVLASACKEEESRETRGYYVDVFYYEVIAYGYAPEQEKNAVKAANMAEENAILKAQMKIYDEFQVPKENPLPSGTVKEKTFIDD